MPLLKSKLKKAFAENVKKEMESGKPQKQAVAIAHSIKRDADQKKSEGGVIEALDEAHKPRKNSIAKFILDKKEELKKEPEMDEGDVFAYEPEFHEEESPEHEAMESPEHEAMESPEHEAMEHESRKSMIKEILKKKR